MIDQKNVTLNQETSKNGTTDSSIEVLKELCANNAEYFSKDNTENGQRMYISFLAMIDAADNIKPKVKHIQNQVSAFDFDEKTPGNGYRSFLYIVDLALQLAVRSCEKVTEKRASMLFRKNTITK